MQNHVSVEKNEQKVKEFPSNTFSPMKSQTKKSNSRTPIGEAYMGQIPQDGENEQYVALFLIFEALLWPNGWTFSSFINCSEEILSVGP